MKLKNLLFTAVLLITYLRFAPYASAQEKLLKIDAKKLKRNAASRMNATTICGTDTILYPYLKEIEFTAPNDSFFVDAMVGNVRTASQAYKLNSEVRIKGIHFWGAAYSTNTAPQTLAVKAYLYSVDAFNMPVATIDSALVTITEQYGYYIAMFDTPKTINTDFAVGVRSNINDTLAVITNNANNTWSTNYAEGLAWRRFGSGTWNSSLSFFGQDLEYMISPIVEYDQPQVDFTTATTGCVGNEVSFQNNSSSIFSERMFNLIQFSNYWKNTSDTTFKWTFGDGSDPVYSIDATHTYSTPGTYTVTLKGTITGYYSECNVLLSKEIVIEETPVITQQPSSASICPGAEITFTATASGDVSYQWQEKINDVFTDISGEQSANMAIGAGHTISSATYRVLISNNCLSDLPSDEVTLTAEDLTKPVFSSCPEDVEIASSVFNYTLPVATDNCSEPSVTLVGGLASGSEFPEGATTVTYEAEDAEGNKAQCSFIVTYTPVTGVFKSNELVKGIYPNPATEIVIVDLGNELLSEVSLEVVSPSGGMITTQKYSHTNQLKLDVSEFEKGIYYIHVITADKRITGKVIVK